MPLKLLVGATLVLVGTVGLAHNKDLTFYVMFPGTEPVSGPFEATWTPGGGEYKVVVSKARNCSSPVFENTVKTTSDYIPKLNPGKYFFCLTAVRDYGSTLSAQNGPIQFTVK